jgi:hypothetical protein
MRPIPLACATALLPLAAAALGCATRLVPTSPTRVAILLRRSPTTGACHSATVPQLAFVASAARVHWEVVNADCQSPTVTLALPAGVVSFEAYDEAPAGGEAQPFRFRAAARVTARAGRYKYAVRVRQGGDTQTEDPDLDVRPPR